MPPSALHGAPPGLAGALELTGHGLALRLAHRQRRADGAGGAWQVAARDDASGIELALALEASKPPVLQGDAGLSQKSAEAGNASYYFSLPRLRATGTVALDGKQHAVTGLAWLDREWSSSALAADQQGWDWFALQLDNGNELMFYQLRKLDGSRDRHSGGSWIPPDGEPIPLGHDDVAIEVLDHWTVRWAGRDPGQAPAYPGTGSARRPARAAGYGRAGARCTGALLGRRRGCDRHARCESGRGPRLRGADGLRGRAGAGTTVTGRQNDSLPVAPNAGNAIRMPISASIVRRGG
ncbi:MAG: lipocalin-like domain-containing protein [Woeseiaceae bacterium]|nr:lipocalin-like domain-containing protein [Woeseiaceae bacterium]